MICQYNSQCSHSYNQKSNIMETNNHYYLLIDGTKIANRKALCDYLEVSKTVVTKLVKKGVIKSVTISTQRCEISSKDDR